MYFVLHVLSSSVRSSFLYSVRALFLPICVYLIYLCMFVLVCSVFLSFSISYLFIGLFINIFMLFVISFYIYRCRDFFISSFIS